MKYLVHIHHTPTEKHPNYPNEESQNWLLGRGGGTSKDTPYDRRWMALYHGYKRRGDALRALKKEANSREELNYYGYWLSTYYIVEVDV